MECPPCRYCAAAVAVGRSRSRSSRSPLCRSYEPVGSTASSRTVADVRLSPLLTNMSLLQPRLKIPLWVQSKSSAQQRRSSLTAASNLESPSGRSTVCSHQLSIPREARRHSPRVGRTNATADLRPRPSASTWVLLGHEFVQQATRQFGEDSLAVPSKYRRSSTRRYRLLLHANAPIPLKVSLCIRLVLCVVVPSPTCSLLLAPRRCTVP